MDLACGSRQRGLGVGADNDPSRTRAQTVGLQRQHRRQCVRFLYGVTLGHTTVDLMASVPI